MKKAKVALLTDSASDLSEELLNRYRIKIIPLRVNFGGRTYRDRAELSAPQLFERMEQEPPSSSLPSCEDIQAVLEGIQAEGYTDVLYIGMSSGLSGTFQFVRTLGEERPGIRFHSVDSKTLSCGQSALVTAAARVLETTGSLESTIRVAQDVRARMRSYFVLRNLSYLRKGGRIGNVEGTVGSLLRISPVISVNNDGVYETTAKTVGFHRGLSLLIKEMKQQFSSKRIVLYAVHSMEEEAALGVIDQIRSFSDVAEANLAPLSAALGVHTGPGLVGLVAYEIA